MPTTRTNRPSATKRGYGPRHRNAVNRLRATHIDGTPCYWCGQPMYNDRTLNPDYNPDATRTDGKPDTTSGVLAGDHTNGKGGGALSLIHI